jgi:hypothetical protein
MLKLLAGEQSQRWQASIYTYIGSARINDLTWLSNVAGI